MGVEYPAGTEIKGYTVRKTLNVGMNAIAFEGAARDGKRVFLKQYKSPSPRSDWYKGYVDYQAEMRRRIKDGGAASFTYDFIEYFEFKKGANAYWQVFEFIQGGQNLTKLLEQAHTAPASVSWNQRLIISRVVLAGVRALHNAKVVHADLKPDNIYLITDATIKAGYRTKVIDFDRSLLSDKLAPWHGKEGYVGTDGYFSPEHLNAAVPVIASDVFTCGIILYELLANVHPFPARGDEYRSAVQKGKAPAARLVGSSGDPAQDKRLADLLHAMLDLKPGNRPTMDQAFTILTQPSSSPAPSPPEKPRPTPPSGVETPPVEPTPVTPSNPARPPQAPKKTAVKLTGATGKSVVLRTQQALGSDLLKGLDEEGRYFETHHFDLIPEGVAWYVQPRPGTGNELLLNGKAVTAKTEIKAGHVLAVGREAKGVQKCPLKVEVVDA